MRIASIIESDFNSASHPKLMSVKECGIKVHATAPSPLLFIQWRDTCDMSQLDPCLVDLKPPFHESDLMDSASPPQGNENASDDEEGERNDEIERSPDRKR